MGVLGLVLLMLGVEYWEKQSVLYSQYSRLIIFCPKIAEIKTNSEFLL